MSNNNTPSSADRLIDDFQIAVYNDAACYSNNAHWRKRLHETKDALRAFISGAPDNQPQGELNATRLDTNDRATAGNREARPDLQHIARDGHEPGSSGVESHPLRGGDGMVVGDITPSTRPGCAGVHLPLDASAASAPLGWLYDWTHSSALGKPDEHFTGFTTDETYARKHDNPRPVWGSPDAANAGGTAPDYEAWGLCSRLNAALEAIGDYAHDRSTGPAVPDSLWEIRRMAYDAMEEVATPTGAAPDHFADASKMIPAADATAKAMHLLHEMACRFHDTTHDDGICERAMAFLQTQPEPAAADESTRAPQPEKREHTATKDCWCEPEVDYVDPETGATVYVHRDTQ